MKTDMPPINILTERMRRLGRCPACGSHRFRLNGAMQVSFETVFDVKMGWEEGGDNAEWIVIEGVYCDECGKKLNDQVEI